MTNEPNQVSDQFNYPNGQDHWAAPPGTAPQPPQNFGEPTGPSTPSPQPGPPPAQPIPSGAYPYSSPPAQTPYSSPPAQTVYPSAPYPSYPAPNQLSAAYPVYYGQPGFVRQPGPGTNAIISLVMSIVGMLFLLSFYCAPFTLIFSGIAVFLGRKETKAIQAGNAPPAGQTMAQVGYVVGLIGLVLVVVGLVMAAIFFAFIFGSPRHRLQ